MRQIEDVFLATGALQSAGISDSGVDSQAKDWGASLVGRDFGFAAKAIHDFNHTAASGFFSKRKKKKSFKEESHKWLKKELLSSPSPMMAVDETLLRRHGMGDVKRSLQDISTSALVAKYDVLCSEILYELHRETTEASHPQEAIAQSYVIKTLGDEILSRVPDADEEAMSFVASRPDFIWGLAQKEKETFGVNKIRSEKLLTAEEVMAYTGWDEDELVVYVWGEMLEGRTPSDSQPQPFGWEKFSYSAEVTLDSMSEQDKSNVRKLMYPGWSVLQLRDAI